MYLKTLILSLLLGVTLVVMAAAQARPTYNDSLGFWLEVRWIEADVQRADVFHQMAKYKLGPATHPDADSAFYPAWKRYERLYAKVPAEARPSFFSAAFYETVIPVAQYFRNAAIITILMDHAATLHPRPAVQDPKHHDADHAGHQHHQ